MGTLFDVCLSFSTAWQSFSITSAVVIGISWVELALTPKIGSQIDAWFHIGSLVAFSIGIVGMFADLSKSYLPLLGVGILACVFIQLYSLQFISRFVLKISPQSEGMVASLKKTGQRVIISALCVAAIFLIVLIVLAAI
jgi:hypothetical protein